MTETPRPPPDRLFRPDAFFLKPWRGWGVVRDARGRTIDRYQARGRGRASSRSAASEQIFTFESGAVTTVEWDILSDAEDHYYARDLKTGLEARGSTIGEDFCWSFPAPAPGPLGRFVKGRATARYTLATPTTAFGFTEIRLFGRLIRTFVTFYEQVDPAREPDA